jgi:hypothetical protein
MSGKVGGKAALGSVLFVLGSLAGGYAVSVVLWHNGDWSYALGMLEAYTHELSSQARPGTPISPTNAYGPSDVIRALWSPFVGEILLGAAIFWLAVVLPLVLVGGFVVGLIAHSVVQIRRKK